MHEIATAIVDACWIFGALAAWPVLRFVARLPAEKLRVLKWLFWLQVFWLLIGFLAVHYFHSMPDRAWLRTLPLPFLVGSVSWLTVLAALLAISVRSRQKTT
jgi:hypothetical protein